MSAGQRHNIRAIQNFKRHRSQKYVVRVFDGHSVAMIILKTADRSRGLQCRVVSGKRSINMRSSVLICGPKNDLTSRIIVITKARERLRLPLWRIDEAMG